MRTESPTLPRAVRRAFAPAPLALAASSAAAQTPDGEQGGASADGAAEITLLNLFQQGGWAMYPLFLFSVLGVSLIVYCAFLIRETRFTQPDVKEAVLAAIDADDGEGARAACDERPGFLSGILRRGLEVQEQGHPRVEQVNEAMEERAAKILSAPLVFVQYLQVLASVSPMLGLLGTVSGMVKAFRNIAAQGLGKPELLANNISEALITTATGLIIAIPVLMAYFYFKNKYNRVSSGVYEQLGDVTRRMLNRNWLSA